ncbi:putative protein [Geobacter sp. OR-1]|uniref:rhamnan synthesis F family protein n=1 Tax=Geobacter sp. OR-1 TaxID=1266765 RepID=UPI000542CC1E|nr:rhamnan synthesis F family protein [Geobacter sp. OR-1]GAM09744.1 putative protein [Geobacter sp. OR-1]
MNTASKDRNSIELIEKLDRTEQQLQIAKIRIAQLDSQLNLVYSSLSWRITSPLRRVGLKLPQLFRLISKWLGGASPSYSIHSKHKTLKGQLFDAILDAESISSTIGIHLHLDCFDLLDEIASYLVNIPFDFDLYVSTIYQYHENDVQVKMASVKTVRGCFVKVVQNRGSDIASYVSVFAADLLKYDYVCYIHSNISLYSDIQQNEWRKHLLDNLMGSVPIVRKIFGIFTAYEDVGIIYPETYLTLPYWTHAWLSNKQLGQQLCNMFGIAGDFSGYLDSPKGAMFWARPKAIAPLLSAGFKIEEFPEESGQIKGTLIQTLERMIVPIAHNQGYTFCEINTLKKEFSISFGSRNLHQYWQKSLDGLKQEILKYEVITFDIFDTLVTRPLIDPDTVFDLLEIDAARSEDVKNFREIRKRAESEIRGEIGFSRDVGIEEIYHRIRAILKIDGSIIERLCKHEMEIEVCFTRARPEVVEALRFAKEHNKHVILMSDMYLDAKTIRAILTANGIAGYDELYLSSELGVRKDNATMWMKLLENYSRTSILHIGDNEHSDVQIPSELKIAVYHVMSPKNLFNNSFIGRELKTFSLAHNIANSAILGMTINYLCNNPFAMHDYAGDYKFSNKHGFGYAVIGPVIFAYLTWLLKSVIKDNIVKILFLAREGYLLKRIFDMFLKHKDVANKITERIETVYLLASRRATTVPAIANLEDALYILKKPYKGDLFNLMETRFGISTSYLKGKNVASSYVELPTDINKIAGIVRNNFDAILAVASKENGNYLTYLNELGINADKVGIAVSDVGYSGNIQKALSRLLGSSLTGYYFATCLDIQDGDKLHNKFKGYLTENDDPLNTASDMYRYSLIFESILTAPDGQLVCFEHRNGELEPVFGKPNEQFNHLMEIHEGITAYCCDMLNLHGRYLLGFEPDRKIVEYLFGKAISENKVDKTILSKLSVEDKYCQDQYIAAI